MERTLHSKLDLSGQDKSVAKNSQLFNKKYVNLTELLYLTFILVNYSRIN